MNPPPFNSTPDYVKQNFIGIANKRVTIHVGHEVGRNIISGIEPWANDVYEAIRFASSKGYIGCRDYSWITYKNGKIIFYDDNYCNYLKSSEKNTLTRGWFILHKNPDISNMYLKYNKIKYQYMHGVRYHYKKCIYWKRSLIGSLRNLFGGNINKIVEGQIGGDPVIKGALNTISNNPLLMGPLASVSGVSGDALGMANDIMGNILSGDPIGAISSAFSARCGKYFYYKWSGERTGDSVGEGIKIGMDKWLKKSTSMNQGKPSNTWKDRQSNMRAELNYHKGCNSNINEPITIYLKSGDSLKYLRSDSTSMKFTDKKEDYISGWHILMKDENYPWNAIYKTKSISGKQIPYTLIGPGYCKAYIDNGVRLPSSYYKNTEPIKKCAEGVKKYFKKTGKPQTMKYFAFREDTATGNGTCNAMAIEHPCLDKNMETNLYNKSWYKEWKFYKFK